MSEFINQLSQESAIMVLESDIEIDRAISDYMTESSMMSIVDVYVESEEALGKAEESKFKAFINKLIETIKRLAKKVSDGFKNIFVKDNLTAEDYFNDPNVRIEINKDFKKIADELEEEMFKGRKYVQAISKGTGVDDRAIANFCDNAANFGIKEGKYITTGVSIMALSRYYRKRLPSFAKNLEYDYKALDKAVEERIRKNRYAAEDMGISTKYGNKPVRKAVVEDAVKLRRQASSLCSAMGRLFTKYCSISNELQVEVNKAKKRSMPPKSKVINIGNVELTITK